MGRELGICTSSGNLRDLPLFGCRRVSGINTRGSGGGGRGREGRVRG